VPTRRFGTEFQFDVPDGWDESREGARYVLRGPGPGLQELIIQSYVLHGEASPALEERTLQQLVDNAVGSLREALEGGLLAVTRPLGPDPSLGVQPAWSMISRATDDGTVFCGAVFRGSRGVLLLTWEAAPDPASAPLYARILYSVRRISAEGRA
jgi:hypothetical protein